MEAFLEGVSEASGGMRYLYTPGKKASRALELLNREQSQGITRNNSNPCASTVS